MDARSATRILGLARVGDKSLHKSCLVGREPRGWQIQLSAFGGDLEDGDLPLFVGRGAMCMRTVAEARYLRPADAAAASA